MLIITCLGVPRMRMLVLFMVLWLDALYPDFGSYQSSVSATPQCARTFRFDQLCPDPQNGASNHYADTQINLSSRESGNGRHSNSYNGGIFTTTTPGTESCEFQINGMENTKIFAVHMTEKPWEFRNSNPCTEIVRLSYDIYEGSLSRNGFSTSRTRKDKICESNIGIQRKSRADGMHEHHNDLEYEDEVAYKNKLRVYFWHNITLNSYSAEFVDTITNPHLAKEVISCTQSARFVQIGILVSKNSHCQILVQQYKIENTRTPRGCKGLNYQIPHPYPFCGSYDCSTQTDNILVGLKLSHSDPPQYKHMDKNTHHRTDDNTGRRRGGSGNGRRNKHDPFNPYQHKNNPYYKHENCTEAPDYEGQQFFKPTPNPDKEEMSSTTPRPVTLTEVFFVGSFPTFGVVFIIIILAILRSRSAREICRGYPYAHSNQSEYERSFDPSHRNTLPI